jgi:hypothetical protein
MKQPVLNLIATTAGGTIPIDATQNIATYVVSGSGSLSSPLTIDIVPIGTTGISYAFNILYVAQFSDENVTLAGKLLTPQQALTGNTLASCVYDGTAWNVTVTDSTSEVLELILVEVSFETDEICNNEFITAYDGKFVWMNAFVTKAIEGSDDATIQLTANGLPVQDGLITIPAGTALNGNVAVTNPMGDTYNTFSPGTSARLIAAKTTPGGKVRLSVWVQRT